MYLKAIEIEPDSLHARMWYGQMLRANKKYNVALEQFDVGVKINLNDVQFLLEIGFCYHQLRDIESAKKYMLQAIETEPDNCRCYYRYCRILKHSRDYKEAEKYYLKCLEIDDRSCGANASYGYLLYLMGEYDKAMKYIKIELDIIGYSEWGHLYLYHGLVNESVGKDELADEALWKAVASVNLAHADGISQNIGDMMEVDGLNIEYCKKFEKMVKCRMEMVQMCDRKII